MNRILFLTISIFLPFLYCFSQNDTLPIKKFEYPADINFEQPYPVKIQKPYTLFSNPKLNQTSKVKDIKEGSQVLLIELIFVEDLTKDDIERISYSSDKILLINFQGVEGYINPYEQRTITTLEENISQWYKAKLDYHYRKKRIERENSLISKYGDSTGIKLTNLKIEIGMTKEMIVDAMGKPDKINVTQSETGKQEQLIYKNFYYLNKYLGYNLTGGPIYFYVKNGELTTVQY